MPGACVRRRHTAPHRPELAGLPAPALRLAVGRARRPSRPGPHPHQPGLGLRALHVRGQARPQRPRLRWPAQRGRLPSAQLHPLDGSDRPPAGGRHGRDRRVRPSFGPERARHRRRHPHVGRALRRLERLPGHAWAQRAAQWRRRRPRPLPPQGVLAGPRCDGPQAGGHHRRLLQPERRPVRRREPRRLTGAIPRFTVQRHQGVLREHSRSRLPPQHLRVPGQQGPRGRGGVARRQHHRALHVRPLPRLQHRCGHRAGGSAGRRPHRAAVPHVLALLPAPAQEVARRRPHLRLGLRLDRHGPARQGAAPGRQRRRRRQRLRPRGRAHLHDPRVPAAHAGNLASHRHQVRGALPVGGRPGDHR